MHPIQFSLRRLLVSCAGVSVAFALIVQGRAEPRLPLATAANAAAALAVAAAFGVVLGRGPLLVYYAVMNSLHAVPALTERLPGFFIASTCLAAITCAAILVGEGRSHDPRSQRLRMRAVETFAGPMSAFLAFGVPFYLSASFEFGVSFGWRGGVRN